MNFKKLKGCFVQFSLKRFSEDHFAGQKVIWGHLLAIFSRFCKTENAHIGAMSWADIVSDWPPLSIFKKLVRLHPMQ